MEHATVDVTQRGSRAGEVSGFMQSGFSARSDKVQLKFLKNISGYCIDQRKAKVRAGRPGSRGRVWDWRGKKVGGRLLDSNICWQVKWMSG